MSAAQARELEGEYAPESNRLERRAAQYLRARLGGEVPPVSALEPQALHWRTVVWAALAGAISGGILGLGEVILRQYFIGDAEAMSWRTITPLDRSVSLAHA